jgi:hypothetical protein
MERLCLYLYKINAFPYAGVFLRHFIFLLFNIFRQQISLNFHDFQKDLQANGFG